MPLIVEAFGPFANLSQVQRLSAPNSLDEPEEGLIAIGSGGPFAQSAAKALLRCTDPSAMEIVTQSLTIAGEICIYTNHNFTIEELDSDCE